MAALFQSAIGAHQHGLRVRAEALVLNLLVPGKQDSLQPVGRLLQAAGRHLHLHDGDVTREKLRQLL